MDADKILLFFGRLLPLLLEDVGALKALETAADKKGDQEVKRLLRQLIMSAIEQSQAQVK